jgi:hypothetical protein
MAFIHSGIYKLRKSMLLESGGVQIVEPFCRYECNRQRLGYDQVTMRRAGNTVRENVPM